VTDKNLQEVQDAIDRATTAEVTDLAATLRDIAASCDKTTGNVLNLCSIAASNGKASLIVKVFEEDRDYLCLRERVANGKAYQSEVVQFNKQRATPLIERLESLGFKLESTDKLSWTQTKPFIKITW